MDYKSYLQRSWKLAKATAVVWFVLFLFFFLVESKPLIFGVIAIGLGVWGMIWALRKMFSSLRR